MTRPLVAALLSLVCVPGLARAQSHGPVAPPSRLPPAEARQFDFLIGQWELTVTPKATSLAQRLHGAPRLGGTWKAWRAFDGWGVEDEIRIIDRSGNPLRLAQSLRGYDQSDKKWVVSTFDVYQARLTTATAEWTGREMQLTERSVAGDGAVRLVRTRFSRITPSGFTLRQDRSADGGRTWDENVLTIEAKRVAAEAPR